MYERTLVANVRVISGCDWDGGGSKTGFDEEDFSIAGVRSVRDLTTWED